MDYLQFREAVLNNIRRYLPEAYQNCELKTEVIYKVNETMEALTIMPKDGKGVSPMLYLDQFYSHYQSGATLDGILSMIAEEYIKGLVPISYVQAMADHKEEKRNIIYELINTEKNKDLLKRVPHREYLNLSIIYRIMMDLPDGSFNSAIITNNLAESMQLREDELYELASENTKHRLELRISGIPDVIYMLSNEKKAMGAAVILYPGVLESVAEGFQSDVFVLPSSIHEVMIVRDMGQSVSDLKQTVLRVNGSFVDRDEYLSESVYLYKRAEARMVIVEE